MIRRRLVRRAWIAALMLAACRDLVDPPLPATAERFTPPPVYARWWAMTEACSGMSGRLDAIRWHVVPGVSTFESRGLLVNGYWSAGSNQIVLSGTARLDGPTVRHEMLHALVGRAGHPRELFLRRCAGLVSCGPVCFEDANAPREPDASAVLITVDALQVAVEVSPASPLAPGGDGFLTMTVSARNPASHPVVLERQTTSASGYFFEIVGGGERRQGGILWLDPEVVSFAPGEVKRQVFDFPIASPGVPGLRLVPGRYTFTGAYARKSATIVRDIP